MIFKKKLKLPHPLNPCPYPENLQNLQNLQNFQNLKNQIKLYLSFQSYSAYGFPPLPSLTRLRVSERLLKSFPHNNSLVLNPSIPPLFIGKWDSKLRKSRAWLCWQCIELPDSWEWHVNESYKVSRSRNLREGLK